MKLVDDALAKNPNSEQLLSQKATLESERKAYLSKLKKQMDLLRGEYLIQERSHLNKRKKAELNNKTFSRLLNDRNTEYTNLSKDLGTEGMKALDKKHFKTAKKYLTLANQLSPKDW